MVVETVLGLAAGPLLETVQSRAGDEQRNRGGRAGAGVLTLVWVGEFPLASR